MERTRICAVVLAFTPVFAAQAMAETEQPVTREEVKADLAEAMRTGNMLAGEDGKLLNEVYPNNYPAPPEAPAKTRDQVRAELEADTVRYTFEGYLLP